MRYRYYTFLLTMENIILLASLVLVHRQIPFWHAHCSLSSFIFPFIFPLNNIIAETYSYQDAKNALWLSLFAQIPFAILCALSIYLPPPETFRPIYAFSFVFNDTIRIATASLIATAIGINTNTYLCSKLRYTTHRLRFIWRSAIASLLGELVFTLVAVPLMFISRLSAVQIISFIKVSLLIKCGYCLLLAFPSGWLMKYLQMNEEHCDFEDKYHYFAYNPYDLHLSKST